MTLRRLLGALVVMVVLTAGAPVAARAAAPNQVAGQPAGVSDSIVRLYVAALGRQPDGPGLVHWTNHYVAGMPLRTIAGHFAASPEFAARYGNVDDAGYITLLYRNALGREPDAAGHANWMRQLRYGGMDRGDLLVGFSESAELIARTGTAPPTKPIPALPAGSGNGRRIVYSNSQQRVWLVEANGTVSHSHPVSGRAGVPRPGTYQVFSKSPLAWAAGNGGVTMRNMVRFARGSRLAIGFHAIPRYPSGRPLQSTTQLGTFRSAGCVRQADADAAHLYAWSGVGTTVVVTP
ncbi:MAG: DUF4214 domain-containing protein [Actinomycetota bacterium]|nr:DUF4214 domain-containing protein [Actinomycetota bacterium]